MKPFLKNFFYAGSTIFSPSLGNHASILMYHSVAESEAFFAVSPQSFSAQMDILARSGRTVRKLVDIVGDLHAGRSVAGSVAITFDDGYRDNHKHAYAMLKEHNFPATIFLATGSLGDVRVLKNGMRIPVLSSEEVQEMAQSGLIDFGAHTVVHPDLTTVTREAVRYEMEESKRVVETLTGAPCTLFAYPYGRHNTAVVEEAKAAGFFAAVTVREGLASPRTDRFLLPRNAVDSVTSLTEFRGKISRVVGWYNALKVWK